MRILEGQFHHPFARRHACDGVDGVKRGRSEVAGEAKHVSRNVVNTTPFAVMMHRILHVLMRSTVDTHDILIRSASSVLRLHVNNSMMSRK
jgi:hypothetical protein